MEWKEGRGVLLLDLENGMKRRVNLECDDLERTILCLLAAVGSK